MVFLFPFGFIHICLEGQTCWVGGVSFRLWEYLFPPFFFFFSLLHWDMDGVGWIATPKQPGRRCTWHRDESRATCLDTIDDLPHFFSLQ